MVNCKNIKTMKSEYDNFSFKDDNSFSKASSFIEHIQLNQNIVCNRCNFSRIFECYNEVKED